MGEVQLIEKFQTIVELLDEIENYSDELPLFLSNIDSGLSDLYHYIENNKLTTNQCYRMVKEIKKQRENRRTIKNNMELIKTYKIHQNKLLNKDNRKMLLAEINKTNKKLNYKYQNRVYTEETLNEILN